MYEKGLALNTGSPDARMQSYLALGDLYNINQNNPQKALDVLGEAFLLSPDHSGLVSKLSDLYRQTDQLVQHSYFQATVYVSMYGMLKVGMDIEHRKLAYWFTETCNDKLLHDVAQLEILLAKSQQQGQTEGEMHLMLRDQIIPGLRSVAEENAGLEDGGHQQYHLTPENWESVKWFYNRAIYTPNNPVLSSAVFVNEKILPDDFESSFSKRKMVAIQGLVTPEFAIQFTTFSQEATVWHGFNRAKNGYLTAMTGQGLDSELLAQFAMQVKDALPVLRNTRFKAAWAAKHLHTKPSSNFKVDGGDIMVKVWLQDQRHKVSYAEGMRIYARRAGAQWMLGTIKAREGDKWSVVVDGVDEPQPFSELDMYPGLTTNGLIMYTTFITSPPPIDETDEVNEKFAMENHLQNVTAMNTGGVAVVYSKMAYAHFSGPSDVPRGEQPYMQHAVELTLEFETLTDGKDNKNPKDEL
jgi:hypothetical protein